MRWAATCAPTGEIFDTTELTGARTGATSVATNATFGRTAANCVMTYETEIIGPLATSDATSETTSATCAPTAAIFGMTVVTSGTIAVTFATTGEGNNER